MKLILTLFSSVFLGISAFSQGANAVVFSENGEKFTILLNGEKQNDTPLVNVKIKGLSNEFYQARVDFEDSTLPDFTMNNFAVKSGYETTYVIRKNKKGEYVLRWAQETVSGSVSASPNTSDIKNYAIVDDEAHGTPTPEPSSPSKSTTSTGTTGAGVNQSVTVTETTKTTTKPSGNTNTTGVNMNMNVEGFNMGVNMQVTEPDEMEMHSETTVTTTTTTTKTTGTPQTTKPATNKPTLNPTQPTPRPREEVVVTEPTGKGCLRSMDASSFAAAKKSISDKGFDDSRLAISKQIAKANCLSVAQIKEICEIFAFEESKLEFAKFAHDHCHDPSNYFQLGEVFSFDSSTEELLNYIEGIDGK